MADPIVVDRVVRFLEDHGAAEMEHPGGTLLTHLRRTSRQLEDWGAADPLTLAGLAHATYGTDGFAPSLLPLDERGKLVELIGEPGEQLVYFYASCDRDLLYPQLRDADRPTFRDRFTDETSRPAPERLRPFLELTFANELDIIAISPVAAAAWGPSIRDLFAHCERWVSPAAYARFVELLAPV